MKLRQFAVDTTLAEKRPGSIWEIREMKTKQEEKDLIDIQKIAVEEGISYQTLMSSVLHKFVSGRLKNVS